MLKNAMAFFAMLLSVCGAQSKAQVGTILVDGIGKPVYYEENENNPRKFFLDDAGNRIDIRTYSQKIETERWERNGVFGKRLYDRISAARQDEKIEVDIAFSFVPSRSRNAVEKLTRSEAATLTQESHAKGISELESKLGKLGEGKADFKGKNQIRVSLSKSDLLLLKYNRQFRSIELPADPKDEKVSRTAKLEDSYVGTGWSSGGLHYSGDCGMDPDCGSGVHIGVLEPNPIWDSDSADHLDGSWFRKRPGTPVYDRHPHGLWTSGILRNSGPGGGLWYFDEGGSYQANVSLGYPVSPTGTMVDAYEWLHSSQFTSIINHSWQHQRYLGGSQEAAANEMERQMDIHTAEYPYVLNVAAAGNSGEAGDNGENDACVDSSAVYNPPGWTVEQCQRVGWWNHNSLIVGSVNDNSTRSAFSAFRDGDRQNEAPHVVARGAGVELPWMAPYDSSSSCPGDTATANTYGPLCGTSMASATITSLAANLAGIGGLTSYPEVIKGIVMASATKRPIGGVRWPTSSSSDFKNGVGIPEQPTADSIVRNEKYGSSFSSGAYGFKKTYIPITVDNYMEWDTITITHSQTGWIHFYLTWVSSPANRTAGTRYDPDDLDLLVSATGLSTKVSQSVRNTTEYVAQPIVANTARTFRVRRNLVNRLLDRTVPIYGSLVWTFDTTRAPVVEITNPVENQLTNQSSVPVTWTIDGIVQGTGTSETLASEGNNLVVRCSGSICDTVTVIRDQTPPVVIITSPGGDTTVSIDHITVGFTEDGTPSSRTFQLDPGVNFLVVDSVDQAGNRGTDTIAVTYAVPFGTPVWPSWSHLSVSDVRPSSLKISWTPAVDDSGVSGYRIYREGVLIDSVPGNRTYFMDVGLFWNHSHAYKVEAGDLRGNWSTDGPDSVFATSDQLPPNPEAIASVLDNTVATTLFAGAEFLFNDTLPIQTGMAPEIIDTLRASVLRGTVRDKNGDPLPGVSISVLGAKAFGSTVTREDGEYDMMINGGGLVTLKMAKLGYLPVQRQLEIPWREYVTFPEISLLQLDTVFQVISLDSSGPMQVFRAGIVTDGDGPRQATLLIPENTSGQKVFPDGSTQPLESITVRATEYTVGENGQKSMPADLPHTSGYTYAVEYSADEALEEGTGVQFNQPIVAYLEDFVGIPVGWSVPSAYYDRKKGQWIPEQDGRVIRIQSISAGMANLEIEEGGSLADSTGLAALGITEAELGKLAILYAAGDSLWRVGIRHFTPYDYNFGTTIFNGGKPKVKTKSDNETDEDDKECGSVIGCQSQTLGESFPIVGTPFTMHYSSSRAKGRMANFVQKIPLTDSALPVGVETVRLALSIAGRSWTYNFAPDTNLSFTFEWDGLDGYGREVQGKQALVYTVGYGYTASYIRPPFMAASFGNGQLDPDAPPIVTRARRYEKTSYTSYMGIWRNQPQKMGEWSINIHHNYDVSGKTLHFGNGDQKKATDFGNRLTISTVAGTGVHGFSGDNGPARNAKIFAPYGIDVAPDGSIYVCDAGNRRIRKISPDGVIETVAGNGTQGYSGDGGLAIDAKVGGVYSVEIAPDGSFYFSDYENHCIRKVDTQGIITTVIGTGVEGFSGDGGPANMAMIDGPSDIAISPDGAIYFGDFFNMRVRKVGTDGIVHTILGNGDGFIPDTDSVPALSVGCLPLGLDLDSDGNLYIADQNHLSLFKVSPDGFFTKVAGNGTYLATGDGGLAVEAGIQPVAIKVVEESNGISILVSDWTNQKFSVRKIDPQGYISTILGGSDIDWDSTVLDIDNGPLTRNGLLVEGIATGSNGEIYIVDSYTHRIRRIDSYLPSFENEAFSIPSQDGREIYSFNSFGLHLKTLDGLTGKALFSFEYDNSGVLLAIVDANGNETSFERDELGRIEKIVSPYGQETFFDLDDSGYIAKVTNPAGEERRYEYTPLGLLTGYLTPSNNLHEYNYDTLGLLKRDDDPAGGYKELSRTETSNGTLSSLVTALGRKKSYLMEKLTTGVARKVNTDPAGLATETTFGTNGQISVLNPDSSKIEMWQAPDPRYGMLSPYPESTIVTLPSGKKSIATRRMGATFADPSDPLTLQTLSDTMVINGRVFTQEYESGTRTQTLIGPEGRTVKRTMDSLGRIIGARVSGLDTVRYSYDAHGRLDSLIRGTGLGARKMALEYDELGNLSNLTDELNRVFGYEYDAAGRRTKAILPDSQEVSFAYDSSGNLISVTPPGKPTHSFGFNTVDLPSEYAPPSLGAGRWATGEEYNLDKQVERVIRPESTQIEFKYDSTGRVTSVQIPDATIRYSYDGSTGKVDTILSRDSISNTYDFDGSLLTKETLSGPIDGEIAFRYNSDFRLDSLGVNGVFVGYVYDQEGLLTQAGGLSLTYGPENSLLRKTTFAGLKDSLAYNGFGELIRQSDSGASGLKYAATFQRDKLGRILEKLETVTGTTTRFSYDYDAQGRLAQVLVDSALYSRYHYDANGNRLARVVPGDSMVGTYDNQDRLSHYGSLAYLYTSNGDLSAKVWGSDTTWYTYDVLGNLLSVQMPGGPLIEYLIDGKNRRVGKKVNGTLVQGFLYQNQLKPVAELDGSGTVVARFVYASKANVPDLMIKGGVAYRIISDYLGSPLLVINTVNDSVVQRMAYDEFGNLHQNTNPGFQPFGYAGGIYDSHTSFVRFGARDFDSWSGRWTAKDPLGFSEGLNFYAYVDNDPINFIDPSGFGKVGFCIRALKGGWKTVSKNRARKALDEGGDAWVTGPGNSKKAKQLANEKWGDNTVRHDPHAEGWKPHYQPKSGGGHVFYDILTGLTAVGLFGDNAVSQGLDLFNPLSDVKDIYDLFSEIKSDQETDVGSGCECQ